MTSILEGSGAGGLHASASCGVASASSAAAAVAAANDPTNVYRKIRDYAPNDVVYEESLGRADHSRAGLHCEREGIVMVMLTTDYRKWAREHELAMVQLTNELLRDIPASHWGVAGKVDD